MSNQEILNTLSGLEAAFYYRIDRDPLEGVSLENTKEIHDRINKLLLRWHELTGCTLTD